ncbi:tubulointerstitial nephritis antigen-like, partial [Limulus polyphemus]|uniref:Tubulointerstitial nephritis antigen-like n=1 Tax=Limulus polyphemus TaxID=6850 RepID=A0ABM1C301_LIMPO
LLPRWRSLQRWTKVEEKLQHVDYVSLPMITSLPTADQMTISAGNFSLVFTITYQSFAIKSMLLLDFFLHITDFVCEDKPCLIQPKLIEAVNQGNYGWRASNYSFFWGLTLEEGISYRLGTLKPHGETVQMNEIHAKNHRPLQETFDSRLEWPGLIQEISDQGNCSSSWAFSTAALSSDRRAIQSKGRERITLSPQQLISCNSRGQKGCQGGHVDRAWWFMRKQGCVHFAEK